MNQYNMNQYNFNSILNSKKMWYIFFTMAFFVFAETSAETNKDFSVFHNNIPESLDEWIKIKNWELASDNTANNSLYNFLNNEKLSDCFQINSPPNIIKFHCYSRDNIFEMTKLFCVRLTDGFFCM